MNNSGDPADPSVSTLFNLAGRVALVTGARGHLGFSLARGLAEAGARVIASSRQLRHAEEVAEQLAAASTGDPGAAPHLAVQIDHLHEDSINRGFDDAVRQAGRVDILVNCGHDAISSDWQTVTAEQFQRQLANVTGYFLLARRCRDQAVNTRRSASVILLGSMYGLVGSYPDAYEGICSASPAAYHALKGGVVQLTRHLAVYWAKDQVRVNCLSPGPFPGAQAPGELVDRLNARSPMGRMGLPHELKGAVVFLASDASSYVTGQNLVVDGGWTAW